MMISTGRSPPYWDEARSEALRGLLGAQSTLPSNPQGYPSSTSSRNGTSRPRLRLPLNRSGVRLFLAPIAIPLQSPPFHATSRYRGARSEQSLLRGGALREGQRR